MIETKKRSKQEWRQHLAGQKQSGLIAADYCRLHNLNQKSFSSRKSELAKEPCVQNFIPINPSRADKLSIKLKSGLEIVFDKAPDPLWFASLLGKLEVTHDQH